ncbi:MAG: ATP-binding protein [Rubrivivax sp.]|nr:ATP-binding protein [Rubrivivax sp.]
MLALPEGPPRQAAGWRLAMLPAPLLAGCADAPVAGGAWAFLSLALVGAALGGYAIGAARQRQRYERELRQAHAALRHQAQLQTAWVWQTDASHRLLSWQGPGRAATQASALFAEAMDESLAARLRAEQSFAGLRVRCAPAQDDSQGWELSGVPRHDDLGRFAGFVGHARPTDGEDRVQAEAAAPPPLLAAGAESARVANDATRESEAFSFTVSHDLRAPIRVVEGFTRIVKEDYGRLLDRVGNDHLDRVLGAAARMNLMIDALLTLARLSSQPLASQPVNLSQLASFVVDDLRRTAPEREADIEIEPGLTAQGDPTLLRLVLENLLGNAWKYSARTPRAQISLRLVNHGGRPAYAVRDNGAGFDMRSADRLFGLFQRLHSASEFPGHGVGLASVRRIVQRHGGDIWAEAEPGRGAVFYFTLAG